MVHLPSCRHLPLPLYTHIRTHFATPTHNTFWLPPPPSPPAHPPRWRSLARLPACTTQACLFAQPRGLKVLPLGPDWMPAGQPMSHAPFPPVYAHNPHTHTTPPSPSLPHTSFPHTTHTQVGTPPMPRPLPHRGGSPSTLPCCLYGTAPQRPPRTRGTSTRCHRRATVPPVALPGIFSTCLPTAPATARHPTPLATVTRTHRCPSVPAPAGGTPWLTYAWTHFISACACYWCGTLLRFSEPIRTLPPPSRTRFYSSSFANMPPGCACNINLPWPVVPHKHTMQDPAFPAFLCAFLYTFPACLHLCLFALGVCLSAFSFLFYTRALDVVTAHLQRRFTRTTMQPPNTLPQPNTLDVCLAFCLRRLLTRPGLLPRHLSYQTPR